MKKTEVIRCSSCGSVEIENVGDGVGKCKHCNSTMILPRKDEEIIALLNAAYVYRENFNYDLAIKSYQFVLEKDSNELSAYEGILLSKYGIEYVKDSYSGKMIPTCHRAHFKSIFEDDYYKTLITLASDEQKRVIEEKAKAIDNLQKAIERQLKNEQEYDVFISCKVSDKNGEKTEDSVIAREIYDELVKKNYRVFLSEKSLENRIGSEYEPIIFKALHTSKIFILVGTSKENVEANWVRNEWSRFIDRIKNGEDLPTGCFIPVYRDMNPYDMPKINNTFVQGVDASKIGYVNMVVDGVVRLLKPEKEQKVISVFDDVENFAEFERIKKKRSKELKKSRWDNLKNSKGIKKFAYFAFLYSPYLFGLLAVIFSTMIGARFVKNVEFSCWLILTCISFVLSVVTLCVQAVKFGMNPILQVVIPFTLTATALVAYLICVFTVPLDFRGRPAKDCGFGHQRYKDGIIYAKYDSGITVSSMSEFERYTKIIDGKKFLILPDKIDGTDVAGGEFFIPKDYDAVVLPKNAEYPSLYLEKDYKLTEIYCYDMTPSGYVYSTLYLNVMLGKPYKTKEIEDLTQFTVYYEISPAVIGGDWNSYNKIQKDLEFYN